MDRCIICGWRMSKDDANGCVPGNCCFRPDDPTEQRKLGKRRALVQRATETVKAAWAASGETPFPLYDREARAIAVSVIQLYEEPR
jgi:hypothetical protein